uniref:Uncharacterized protein n=1 Tax=Sphaerodactylus townsendi TaxID=933632 RepID=A0ACB8FUJ5_9SAUR
MSTKEETDVQPPTELPAPCMWLPGPLAVVSRYTAAVLPWGAEERWQRWGCWWQKPPTTAPIAERDRDGRADEAAGVSRAGSECRCAGHCGNRARGGGGGGAVDDRCFCRCWIVCLPLLFLSALHLRRLIDLWWRQERWWRKLFSRCLAHRAEQLERSERAEPSAAAITPDIAEIEPKAAKTGTTTARPDSGGGATQNVPGTSEEAALLISMLQQSMGDVCNQEATLQFFAHLKSTAQHIINISRSQQWQQQRYCSFRTQYVVDAELPVSGSVVTIREPVAVTLLPLPVTAGIPFFWIPLISF